MNAPTRYWHRLDDGRIQCDLCPRACKLREGQRGLCFVRAREGDEIVLTTYGRSSGFCVDPIEKKPLNHFLPGTPVLSFGTAGCNLACRFCQNWDISKSREIDTLADAASPEAIAAAAERLGCASVAFTYNDPVDLPRVRDRRRRRLPRAWDQSGRRHRRLHLPRAAGRALRAHGRGQRRPEGLHRALLPPTPARGHSQPVLETLEYLRHETGVWLEITTLLIPGLNDSDGEIDAHDALGRRAARTGRAAPLHRLPSRLQDARPAADAAGDADARARRSRSRNGVRYAYTGNVHDREGDSTFCSGCGACVIERDWYLLGDYGLTDDGRCRACGTRIPGVFAGPPSSWGRHRLPVRLSPA